VPGKLRQRHRAQLPVHGFDAFGESGLILGGEADRESGLRHAAGIARCAVCGNRRNCGKMLHNVHNDTGEGRLLGLGRDAKAAPRRPGPWSAVVRRERNPR
jgi:hypothetical protein